MNNSSKDKTETTYNNLGSTSSIIPHIQVIPAKQEAENWIWSYIQKKTCCCQVLVEKDSAKYQCEWFCQKKTSTTSIADYLRMKHRIIEGKEDIETEIVSKQDNNFFLYPYKRKQITNCLLAWLIDNMQVFHIVNNSKFQELFYEAVSQYSVPCKNSLYKKMSEAKEKKSDLVNEFWKKVILVQKWKIKTISERSALVEELTTTTVRSTLQQDNHEHLVRENVTRWLGYTNDGCSLQNKRSRMTHQEDSAEEGITQKDLLNSVIEASNIFRKVEFPSYYDKLKTI
ncbi:12242_t:CDS:2 [Acaulospora morrowiae]|uniref:12242_t:CDS:1 n=1 Tax=Acaulospora morrowiae TaxID=94023 RepID=A0A9N8WSV0_9GLOM|nr:12242_t:CDS:2 [Acaulospora morrowiae]